jgi:3-methylcrotonyl-CoA carboxylase alpha subunit
MEMNTRLQVEHPVTEEITGQDLVEWQLRVASGEKLPKKQDELSINGWAIEARLYAEDPAKGFLPSVGYVDQLVFPDTIRIEAGLEQGDTVSPFYDPMVAKLVAHENQRDAAIEGLADACREVVVEDPTTNAWFLARLLDNAEFRSGEVSTNLIVEHESELCAAPEPSKPLLREAANYLVFHDDFMPGDASNNRFLRDRGLVGFRLNASFHDTVRLRVDGKTAEVSLPQHYWFEHETASSGQSWLGQQVTLHEGGAAFRFTPDQSRGSVGAAAGDGAILAPMPGKVTSAEVSKGEKVAKGQRLLTLEAMKMEHGLVAPFDGVVAELNAKAGAQVQVDAVLAVVKQEDK